MMDIELERNYMNLYMVHREVRFGPCFRISHTNTSSTSKLLSCSCRWDTQASNLQQEEKEIPWEEGKANVQAFHPEIPWICMDLWLAHPQAGFCAIPGRGQCTVPPSLTNVRWLERFLGVLLVALLNLNKKHCDLWRIHHSHVRYCFQWREVGNQCVELACATTEQSRWHTSQAHTRYFDRSGAFSIMFIMIFIRVVPGDA